MTGRLFRLLQGLLHLIADLRARAAQQAAEQIGQTVEETQEKALELSHNRLLVAAGLFIMLFLTILGRLVDLTILGDVDGGPRIPMAQKGTSLHTQRAEIIDRNGVILATSLPVMSLYANPADVLDPQAAARKLVTVLPDLNEADVAAKLASNKGFVWLQRHLTPRQEYEVNALGIPGLSFQPEEERVYPLGPLVAHVVGFTDIDNHGLSGIEKSYDQRLRTNPKPLRLTIDARVQQIVRDEVWKAFSQFKAAGATGIVMDVRNGDILALVSLPDFDPNDPGASPPTNLFDRATEGVYEQGSVFKIFNTAMALESGTSTLSSVYDASHPIAIGRFHISDFHGKDRWLSVPEIFMYSSNIGSAKMAMAAGVDAQKAFFAKLGMLRPLNLDLPEVGTPMIPHPWRDVNGMTIAFGHGMAVSPLHLVTGVSAMVNGGTLYRPTLVRPADSPPPVGRRVISHTTSDAIRRLMRLVVLQGTGHMAEAPGYVAGGKTGTAEKVGTHGHYRTHELYSSFIGAFPLDDPRYVVLVSLDEPHGDRKTWGFATGGWVAAPAFSHIVTRMGTLLGMPPQKEDSPQVLSAMAIDIHSPEKKVAAE